MRNLLHWLMDRLPLSICIGNDISRDLYHWTDEKFIRADNKLNNHHFTKNIRGYNASFNTPSVESWKMVNRRLAGEIPLIEAILDEVEQGTDTFYDVGANIGTFSCFVGQQAEQTLAFEPYPPNASILRENAALNEIVFDIYEVAVGAECGNTDLHVPITEEVGAEQSTTLDDHPLKHEFLQEITVDCLTLDHLVFDRGAPVADVIKIDVEGAGVEVLQGMDRILKENEPTLFIEPHLNSAKIEELLSKKGFSVGDLSDQYPLGHTVLIAKPN